jgi:two-component system sensor histidine kinase DegS
MALLRSKLSRKPAAKARTALRRTRHRQNGAGRNPAAATHVAIIGAGRGGTALMEIFLRDPLVEVVGIAEINPKAPGAKLARKLKIPVTQDYRELLALESVDLLIDVTGNAEVERVLQDFHRMGLTVIGGASAKFMWQLIEARIRATSEIEKTLTRYQSLYRLYVKEAGSAVTEERTRIACEIHDGLVQNLAGVNFKLDLCEELIDKDPAACARTLRGTRAELKLAIQEARQVIFNLRPLHYDQMELIPALKNYLKSYETQYHVKTEFAAEGREGTLFPKTKIFLFRMIQEALSNVQKHAKADRVSVQLLIGPKVLTVTISDTGVGFDVDAIAKNPEKWDHFGLRGIVERARLVGGDAKIESKKGQGTHIVIEVPLVQKEGGRDGTH